MTRSAWNPIPRSVFASIFIISFFFWGEVQAGEDGGVRLHHPSAGLTIVLATQPSPARAGDVLLRVDVTDLQGQPAPHARVRLVVTQTRTMPGMHGEAMQEIEATPTHLGAYVGQVRLATPGQWEVIVKVVRPGRPATQAVFSLAVEPS